MCINMDELNRKIEENLKLQEEMKRQLAEMEEIKKSLMNSELQGLMDQRKALITEKKESQTRLNGLMDEKCLLEEKISNENTNYNNILKKLNSIEEKLSGFSHLNDEETIVSEPVFSPLDVEEVVENKVDDVKPVFESVKVEPFTAAVSQVQKDLEPTTLFEEAVKSVESKDNDNTCVHYNNTFNGLKKYDEELYFFLDGLEKSAEYSFKETFTKVGNFLDLFTDKILDKNYINKASVTQDKASNMECLTAKINYIITNQLITLPADNVSYKCSACDEYIKTNCFTFLMMLYKTAVLPKEQLRNSYPIYNDEVMTKCIKCILFVLNRFYVS